ncbi:hypothetical protein NUW54_g8110 [Trametes sanguinea]|uniref:Uncharacterized protein n=1 Tax=Trametes sanguinea TaxID=158606 RepID=A0ACC1PH32_9APHY|nr:hypothetical protein NUW54_g8110 [Trametes sanguinea]
MNSASLVKGGHPVPRGAMRDDRDRGDGCPAQLVRHGRRDGGGPQPDGCGAGAWFPSRARGLPGPLGPDVCVPAEHRRLRSRTRGAVERLVTPSGTGTTSECQCCVYGERQVRLPAGDDVNVVRMSSRPDVRCVAGEDAGHALLRQPGFRLWVACCFEPLFAVATVSAGSPVLRVCSVYYLVCCYAI